MHSDAWKHSQNILINHGSENENMQDSGSPEAELVTMELEQKFTEDCLYLSQTAGAAGRTRTLWFTSELEPKSQVESD